MEPNLPQGAGYAIIIGMGAFFAFLINIFTFFQNRFSKLNTNKADEFSAASRNIPFGLMVVSIVSSWTWSLTLLQSATESYNLGISGGWWYAVGGLIQVSVFSIIAAKVKSNANLVTTFPEMAYFRFGTAGHLSFLWCGLVCNAIVSSCILLGGSAVVSAATGMNVYASLLLIPLSTAIYVYFGGLRSTFISDATHTFVLLIMLIIFVFTIFASGIDDKIGSPGRMVELLSQLEPVDNNYHGSYLTFRSSGGGIFSIQSIITGFGLVNCDQAYWSRAIASNPLRTSSAYFTACICWFVIPFAMGTTLGLGARALSVYSDFPSLSSDEVTAGLAAVATAGYVLGKAGTVLIIIMVFLSVTSSFSGELIAASTLLSYDVYKKYIRKSASPEEVVTSAKYFVFFWALFSFALASAFHAGGISMGWLFNFLGVSTASGVFPIALTFTWNNLNKTGAIAGSILGMILALVAWLVMCYKYLGSITLSNLSDEWVSFTGNVCAIVLGGVLSITISLIKPANFDFNKTRNRTILSDSNGAEASEIYYNEAEPTPITSGKEIEGNVKNNEIEYQAKDSEESSESDLPVDDSHIDHQYLQKQFKKYIILSSVTALIISIIIPVPLSAAPYVFSKGFLTFVVAVIIIWLFVTFTFTIIWPLMESRKTLARMLLDLVGKKSYLEDNEEEEETERDS